MKQNLLFAMMIFTSVNVFGHSNVVHEEKTMLCWTEKSITLLKAIK